MSLDAFAISACDLVIARASTTSIAGRLVLSAVTISAVNGVDMIPTGQSGFGAGFLLEFEVAHLPMGQPPAIPYSSSPYSCRRAYRA